MFKIINKTIFLMLLGAVSTLNASVSDPIKGNSIGATDINTTAVRINFEDNSTNESGFHISGEGIDLDLPANDGTVNKYVYANLENLDCNKTYIIDIWSYNDEGNSSKESRAFNIHSTFDKSCPIPDIITSPIHPGPYIGVTDINDTAVRINFLDNSDNETGFRIFGSDDINVTLPPNDGTVDQNVYANLTGLICNHVYKIQALAFNGSGDSLPTDVRAFNIHTTFGVDCNETGVDVPEAPDSYIGVTDINDTAVRINFVDNSNNEIGFRIFGDINTTLPANDESIDSNVYANLTGLTCDHVYTIQALAFNTSGESLPTDVRAFNIHTTFGVSCN